MRPSEGRGTGGLSSWAPSQASFYPCQPFPGFGTPPGPWQGSLESGTSRGSCPVARMEAPPGSCPDHPAPGPGGAPRGWQAVFPGRPAAVWLRPRGCGLGTTSCLLGGSGWDLQNKQGNRRPAPRPRTSCLWPRPQTSGRREPADLEGCDWGARRPWRGRFVRAGVGVPPQPRAGNKAWESDRQKFKSGICRILAEWHWASDFAALCLRVPFCRSSPSSPASRSHGDASWSPLHGKHSAQSLVHSRSWKAIRPAPLLVHWEPEQSQGIPGPGRAGRDNLADSQQWGGGAADSTKSRN